VADSSSSVKLGRFVTRKLNDVELPDQVATMVADRLEECS